MYFRSAVTFLFPASRRHGFPLQSFSRRSNQPSHLVKPAAVMKVSAKRAVRTVRYWKSGEKVEDQRVSSRVNGIQFDDEVVFDVLN